MKNIKTLLDTTQRQLIDSELDKFIAQIAPEWSKHGNVVTLDDDHEEDFEIPKKPGDMVIFFDFMDDEIEEGENYENINKFADWVYNQLPKAVDMKLRTLGYKFKCDGGDGSGGGLYYWTVLYTPIK